MNILVIGGNRFFGKKLVYKLLDCGHCVTLLNRQNVDDGFGDRVRRIKCDRKDAAALKNKVGGGKWDLAYDQVCFDAPDAKVACEIFRGLTPRYIFTSSLSVYGPGANLAESDFNPFTFKFTETADSKTQYAEAKRQCEAVFHSQNNFEVVSVRFPFVMGTDDYTSRLTWHVRRIFKGEEIFVPNTAARVSFISSDDAALMLSRFASLKFDGPINVCSKDSVALKSLIGLIEERLGKNANFAVDGNASNQSPYGIAEDWYMDISKLESLGLKVSATAEWLPDLIEHVAEAVTREQH